MLAACLSVGFLTLPVATAEAQKKDAAKPPGVGAPPGIVPGQGAPPGMMPGRGYGPSAKKSVKKAAPKKRDLSTVEEADREKLPLGYRVPQEPPDALTTSEEWIDDVLPSDTKARNTVLRKYKEIFQAGLFASDADRKLVADVIRYKLSLLTRKENRERAHLIRTKEILQDVANSPTNKNGPRDVRKFMLKTIAEEAPRLFQYHVIARINGAILLAELSEPQYNEADADGPRKPVEPCIRAAAPLMALVNDKKQLTAPRIWGVNGLVRIAAVTDKAPLRFQIVDTLVGLMNESAGEHEWYQWRLAEGLGKMPTIQNQDKRPVVPQALARVLIDEKRSWLVRAEAAESLGRLPYYQDNIDLGLVAYLTAELTEQMTEAYNKDPKLASWKLCFIKVYGAFRPLDDDQKRGLLTQVEKGPLAGHKRAVQEAFDLVLPIVRKVVTNPEGIDTPQANLKKWLEANPPKSHKIHPDEEPIVKKQGNAGGQDPADVPPVAEGAR